MHLHMPALLHLSTTADRLSIVAVWLVVIVVVVGVVVYGRPPGIRHRHLPYHHHTIEVCEGAPVAVSG